MFLFFKFQMESLVKAMQHPQTGVPVRSQKFFLTTIPNAFTGDDLVGWMINRLDLKDNGN
jgi:regulator of G-protein signaling